MAKVVGVRFRNVGKIYYFNPKNYKVKPGDHVIVETARGVEYGKVVLAPKDVVDDQVVHPLKEVLRVATKDDDEREKYNRERERDAFKICQRKIEEHKLDMKLVGVEETKFGIKVTTCDKLKALELLGRHLGMFTDKVEQTGETTLRLELGAGLEEMAK